MGDVISHEDIITTLTRLRRQLFPPAIVDGSDTWTGMVLDAAIKQLRHFKVDKKVQATRGLLVERFPQCFAGQGDIKKPLAVGIFRAIRKRCPEISASDLGNALWDYTNGLTYLNQITIGTARFDLDGNQVGVVTEQQAEHAAMLLTALQGFLDAKAVKDTALATLRQARSRKPLDENVAA